MLIGCSRNIYFYYYYYQCWKRLCGLILLWKLWYFSFRVLWWKESSKEHNLLKKYLVLLTQTFELQCIWPQYLPYKRKRKRHSEWTGLNRNYGLGPVWEIWTSWLKKLVAFLCRWITTGSSQECSLGHTCAFLSSKDSWSCRKALCHSVWQNKCLFFPSSPKHCSSNLQLDLLTRTWMPSFSTGALS